jgi:nucleoside 2-deoxyribosyltransferase
MIGYLCGPINGLSDAEANGWREAVKVAIPEVEWLDPMRRDYRGKEAGRCREIVEGDLADIAASDVVLVWAERPSWGTAMEMVYAKQAAKRVIAVCPAAISPWVQYHATACVGSVEEARTAVLSEVMR